MANTMDEALDYQEELIEDIKHTLRLKKSGYSDNPDDPNYRKPYLDDYGNILETPNDLGSVLSVLDFIIEYARSRENDELNTLATDLVEQWYKVFEITDTDKMKLPYNRKDYSTILEYLKLQAKQLSNGEWDDFTDSDIGTVLLKLMSFLADMENYNVDKSIAELYLSTCTERSSALLLCKLIGYKPRHYMSAITTINLGPVEETNNVGEIAPAFIEDGTKFPAGSTFTTSSGLTFTTLRDYELVEGYCTLQAYEGSLQTHSFALSDVSELGRITLPDYEIAFNTVKLFINNEEYTQVEDVVINTGDLEFSVHCNEEREIYIQLPSFWSDILTTASTIKVTYLLSNGKEGRIGQGKIVAFNSACTASNKIEIISNNNSIEGYDPETIAEIKVHAPLFAKTMNTIVTLKDFEDVGSLVDGISGVRALDYNDPSSGLVQPTAGPGGYVNDAYKVNVYVLPDCNPWDENEPDNNYYRNTIIKRRQDWEWDDLQYVAEAVEYIAQSHVVNNTIVLEGFGASYTDIDDIVLGVDTGKSATSFLAYYVDDADSLNSIVGVAYTIDISGEDIIITLNDRWQENMPTTTSKFDVFFKQEQILTEAGRNLKDTITKRRLHSLWVTYYDVDIIQPEINVEVYMDSRNTEFESIAAKVKDLILKNYSREYLHVGDPIFASVIGSDILDNFDFIRYVEVGLPAFTDDLIEALPNEFIDIIPPKVTVSALDYKNKTAEAANGTYYISYSQTN